MPRVPSDAASGAPREGGGPADAPPSPAVAAEPCAAGADREPLLSVVLPVWNEAENLRALIPPLREVLARLTPHHEIVVVDGGSADGSVEVARALGCVAFEQTTSGYGGALREGFRRARGRYLVTLDADLSHPPPVLEPMWAQRDQHDLVIASRYVPGGGADMPRVREVLSRVLNRTFGELLAIPVKDISSGYRLYRREALERFETRATDFNVQQELLTGILVRGGRIAEVPFRYQPRVHGSSHARILRFGVSYLRSLWHLFFLRAALFTGAPALRRAPYLLLVALAVCAAYAGALANGWVRWDDDYLVFENPALRTLDGPTLRAMFDWRGSRERFGSQYAPLSDLSYAVDGWVFGWRDARVFHLQGILWHALAAGLLFLVVNRHLRSAGVALTAALLFGLHPVATESVTWISGRRTAMCTALILAAALAWLRALDRRSALAWAGSLVLVVAACLAKQNGVAAPLVLAALAWTRAGGAARPGPAWLLWASLLPHAAVAAVYAGLALEVGAREGIVGGLGLDLAGRAQASAIALAHYAGMLVWPASLRPSYALVFTPAEGRALVAVGAALAAVAAGGTLLALRRGARGLALAGLGAAVTLAPSVVAAGTQIVAERYLHAPLAFIAIAVAVGIARAARAGPPPSDPVAERALIRRRRWLGAALVSVLVALGAATHVRNRAWRHDIALWSDAIAKEPANRVARRLLGEALLRRDGPADLEAAEVHLLEALRLEQSGPAPTGGSPIPTIASRLADIYEARGADPEAVSVLVSAASRFPDSEFLALRLARHHLRRSRPAAAEAVLAAFVARHPEAAQARAWLAALRLADSAADDGP